MPKLPKIEFDKKILEAIPFRNYVYASLVVNLLSLAMVLLLRGHLPPQVPLFYGTAEGDGQLAGSLALIIPNLVAILITAVNLSLAFFIKDEFSKKTLVIAALAATFLASITVGKIIFLVGSF
ncbi:hypothetical protein A2V61_03855 [Candidatus Woesebacteria bacterium RBG_19FT_COMBO_47_8]|uniref:DUF1648 domain-containing protein n=1 Tax=Candidatus Woesebacteria bacterium RBG_13_46_13 TaxID=1802479 RepID=A0A1F7X788_9BACT|nr:MAG: hypothetical protein A2Y68_02045 [Candidatus Woesebacteria bacterium RBG_13_46_13]OGM16804.1 MAG: hypothetical protein A2V61_03855 [Candidatus Woesebacteria bacterium RBG_19FT_COMBO_47_8]HJX59364.1 hypothetical protein [Patescibacteria group bacterium]